MGDTAATFNSLVGDLEYPMFIVTARAEEEPLGCLVGFATQTSIDPPRFAVCLSHENRTFRRGRDTEFLGVHCVPAHAARLAELFGGQKFKQNDTFQLWGLHAWVWKDNPSGMFADWNPRVTCEHATSVASIDKG